MTDRHRPALLPSGPPDPFARGKRPRGERSTPPAPTDLPRGRLLLIDEDSAAASEVADLLGGDGHDVRIEQRLEQALAASRAQPPDVIVIDPFSLGGPGEGFLDPVRRLRDASGTAPEVVVLTSRADVSSAVSALHAGAADFVVKPADPARVRLSIQRAMDRRRLLNENERLKRDLALFAAAQRILEQLEPDAVAEHGLESLVTFGGADAGCVLVEGQIRAERGLSPPELAVLDGRRGPFPFVRGKASAIDESLVQFLEAMALPLGPGRVALLFRREAFGSGHEHGARYIADEMGSAFKNSVRYADAEREAQRDSLTGLWNARTFHQTVERLAIRALRESQVFSLMFVDVDHFKEVNDRHGHVVGSRVLVELAAELLRLLREGDVVARFGGDEFMALLPEVDDQNAVRVAERVRHSIQQHPFRTETGEQLFVTVCIGVASFPLHASTAQGLLDKADRAMYLGKGATRNSVHVA